MKILQIEDEPWDSGIAHYALTLSAELKRRGHEVHFWGLEHSPLLDQAAGFGLTTLGLRRPWASLPDLRSRVRRGGIEIINAHTGRGHALAAALAAIMKVVVVRTRGDARPAAKHPLSRLLASRTRAFIAANARIQAELSRAFPEARVVMIPQGIDAGAARPMPDAPVFGILGRLDPVKGHEILMAAARGLKADYPRARFLAVGGGTPQRRARLDGLVRELGLGGMWEFPGFVEDASAEMQRCFVGVVASIGSEAVSRAALEWMAAGRCVVASAVGCLPDLVVDGETGFLVPPGDSKALAGALKRFLDEPDLALRLGASARRRFDARFTLKRFADETERLYGELLT